jgi:hypothetical protein
LTVRRSLRGGGGGDFYIRLNVILLVLFRTVNAVEVPTNVPAAPKHSAPALVVPPAVADVRAPAASRLNATVVGSPSVLLIRHVTPPTSLIRNATPVTLALALVMFGSVPAKLEYLMCHGSVSVSTVAEPDVHAPSAALVR